MQDAPLKETQKSLASLLVADNPAAAFGIGANAPRRAISRPAVWNRQNRLGQHPTVMTDTQVETEIAPTKSETEEAPVEASDVAPAAPRFSVKDLAGIAPPTGFFDPFGFSSEATEGRIRFYREVELKHGRVAMLAGLGFLVGEQFHPLWGGEIDVPSYIAFQETPLQAFWPAVVLAISIFEVFSVFSFNSPFSGEPWTIRSDHEPGDLGFDPLGLKPTDPKELKEMQTKELNNGRLAMIAVAGMVGQELATGEKLF